jgi:hypothetical protein
MMEEVEKTVALLFESGQVIGVSGIKLNDTMTKKVFHRCGQGRGCDRKGPCIPELQGYLRDAASAQGWQYV